AVLSGGDAFAHLVEDAPDQSQCREPCYGARLAIFMPPGSAKSYYASTMAPAYARGRQPDWNIIQASHSSNWRISGAGACAISAPIRAGTRPSGLGWPPIGLRIALSHTQQLADFWGRRVPGRSLGAGERR